MDDLLKIVPTTRYQGSKRKILPWLYECMRNYEFHTVLDAFGGTGMVSYLFKKMGKRVTYNDLFQFNQRVARFEKAHLRRTLLCTTVSSRLAISVTHICDSMALTLSP